MKNIHRFLALLLTVHVCLLLSACGTEKVYTVDRNGKTYTVDTPNGTISDGTYTYAFTWVGDQVTITYPDGSTYWWEFAKSSGAGVSWGGWSDDYGPGPYADGNDLARLLVEERPDPDRGSHILAALLLFAVGIFSVSAPETAWMLSHGWRYKDAEPSDMALAANRISGAICVLAGIFLLFI